MKRCCTKMSVILWLNLAGICLAQPTYTYSVIPMPAGTQSFSAWIKDDGTIGGGSGLVDAGQGIQLTQCYTYKDGALTVVPTPSANCYFSRGNTSGDFTGYLEIPGVQGAHLFRYHDGGFEVLDGSLPRTLAGPTSAWPNAMNDQGDIAGYAYIQDLQPATSPFGPPPTTPQYMGPWAYYGFVYSGGQIRELPNLGGPMNAVYGMNSNGDAVGFASSKLPSSISDPPLTTHAVLYPHDGGIVDLGTAGGTNSEANRINAAGQIVGRTTVAPGEMDPTHHITYHAFVYDNGSMKVLPAPGIDSSATDINDQGEIVGLYRLAKDDGSVDYSLDHPFYWYRDGSADGKVVDLQNLVPSLPAGTVLTGVSIKNSGQLVVGARQANETQTTMTLLLTPIQAQ
jgi:probable HAF family extracellular repeat protein